jgi:hypothetical protein
MIQLFLSLLVAALAYGIVGELFGPVIPLIHDHPGTSSCVAILLLCIVLYVRRLPVFLSILLMPTGDRRVQTGMFQYYRTGISLLRHRSFKVYDTLYFLRIQRRYAIDAVYAVGCS